MIKSVDSVEGSTNTGFILPEIQHWDRIARIFCDGVVQAIVIPTTVVGVAALTLVTAVILAPIVASRKIAESVSRTHRSFACAHVVAFFTDWLEARGVSISRMRLSAVSSCRTRNRLQPLLSYRMVISEWSTKVGWIFNLLKDIWYDGREECVMMLDLCVYCIITHR